MSCLFAEGHVCYETNEPDDEGWCRDKAGESSDSQCPSGEDGHCIFTPGGDFTGWATAYYYSDFPGEESCEAGNGTYTAN